MISPATPAPPQTAEGESTHKPLQRRWFLKRFFLIFLPMALLAGLGIGGREYLEFTTAETLLAEREAIHVDVTRKALDNVLVNLHHDVMFLRDLQSLQQFLQQPSPTTRQQLEADFLNMSAHRKTYDQIRYLDETGMEVVRVNFNQGQVTSVPSEKLQNKGKRYYFADAFVLNQGEMFVSPLDLNMEQGKIEEPRKSMLRVGTPVYDQAQRKRGIVLVNYFGQILIDRISELLRSADGQPLFVNKDGYWLLASDPSHEWGFMFGNGNTLAQTSPSTWSTLVQEEKGQLWTDAGLYTFNTLYPLLPGEVSSTGAVQAYQPSTQELGARNYFWKVLTKVDAEALTTARSEHIFHGSILYGLVLIGVALASWFLAQAHVTSRVAEEALRMVGFSVDHSADAVFWITAEGELKYANQAACRCLGYTRDELLSLTANDIEAPTSAQAYTQRWQALKAHGALTFESHYRTKDGQTYPVEVSANYLSYGENEYNCTFARDISARKQAEAERQSLHQQLITASREAGMAEIATGVLHNVGNVLNSVTVAATLAKQKLHQFRFSGIDRIAKMLSEHANDLAAYLSKDEKGRKIPEYLATVSEQLSADRQVIDAELGSVDRGIAHIKEIVSTQQSYAGTRELIEAVSLSEVVDDSLKMNVSERHEIDILTEYETLPAALADKHKLIQIIINLVRNAKQSVDEHGGMKTITVRVMRVDGQWGRIEVEDNGLGIATENLPRIFEHGFTTKQDGRGFGLHHSAIAAKNMGGSLSCRSAGPGQGATFVLDLPLESAALVA